jgi:hypothetical protein
MLISAWSIIAPPYFWVGSNVIHQDRFWPSWTVADNDDNDVFAQRLLRLMTMGC